MEPLVRLGIAQLNAITKLPTRAEREAAIMAMPQDVYEAVLRYHEWCEAAKAARASLLKFARFTMPDPEHYQDAKFSKYVVAPHHRLIADAVEEVFGGKCLRLALSMPPQHSKSETATRRGIAYHVGRWPWKHLLVGTYNQTFAEEFGEDVRNIVESEEYARVFPLVKFRKGSKAKDHMVTEDGGKVSFLGRGGSGTGRPADGLLIDDPIKDAKEAESKTTRDDAWNWFTRVANTRCHALSWQIIIATRWSEDDIIGRLTDPRNPHYNADVGKQWTVVNLPAIMDDEAVATALGKKLGDALWPERFPLSLLETARKLDPYGFSALYMGKPTPPEGAFYKQWHIATYDDHKQLPKRFRAYMTGDLAVSPEKNADRSCVGIWMLDEEDTLWLHPDLFWERKTSDETVERMICLGSMYQVTDSWWEKGQLDKAIGPFFEKRHMELVRANKVTRSPDGRQYRPRYFNVNRLPVAGSKGLRSTSIRGRMAQGKVKFPSFVHWWPAAKEELLKFTGSGDDKSDDFCDMLALIGQALDDQVPVSQETQPEPEQKFRPTFSWLTANHRRERARLKLVANQRGM